MSQSDEELLSVFADREIQLLTFIEKFKDALIFYAGSNCDLTENLSDKYWGNERNTFAQNVWGYGEKAREALTFSFNEIIKDD